MLIKKIMLRKLTHRLSDGFEEFEMNCNFISDYKKKKVHDNSFLKVNKTK
jgi:hypothetical protein